MYRGYRLDAYFPLAFFGSFWRVKPLLETTTENFAVKEVAADKAYLSHENLALTQRVGGEAFIPYKINSQPRRGREPLGEDVYYNFRREDFAAHYHQRGKRVLHAQGQVRRFRPLQDRHRYATTLRFAYEVRSNFVHWHPLSTKRTKQLESNYRSVRSLLLMVLNYLRETIVLLILLKADRKGFLDLIDESFIDTVRDKELRTLLNSVPT